MQSIGSQSIRLETHWHTLQEGNYELPVLEDQNRRLVFFYQTGIPSRPTHQVNYGVRLQDQTGETLLLHREAQTLEEALSEFEQLLTVVQKLGPQVFETRSLPI